MSEGLSVESLLASAGQSLGEAQASLVGSTGVPHTMGLADASLELKVSLLDEAGALRVQPVDAERARPGAVSVGALSTVMVRFVPLGTADAAVPPPSGSREAAVAEVAGRDDVKRVAKVLGDLQYETTWVADRRSWLVTATDSRQRVVRETTVRAREG